MEGTLGGSMRERFFKAKAQERIAKDDVVIVDLTHATVMRAQVFKTVADIEEKVTSDVRAKFQIKPKENNMPSEERKLTDRELLFVAYGALKAISFEKASAKTVASMLEDHLWPKTETEHDDEDI